MGRLEIANKLQAIVEAVEGAGKVYTRDRYPGSWTTFLNLFTDDNHKINGCMITRKSKAKQQRTVGEVEHGHIFLFRFFYGLRDQDDTEATFQNFMDQVEAAVDLDETLDNTCETTQPDWGPMNGAIGLQIDTIELRQFGSILCHYAECRLCACETEQV